MSRLLDLVGNGVLFAEDFDLSDNEASRQEMEVIEPMFDQTYVEEAKAAAFDAGVLAGRAELIAEDTAALRQALVVLTEELNTTRNSARAIGEQAAEEIARLMLSALGAVMPVLCEAYGGGEAQAIARAILPALVAEPEITIRANPHTATGLSAEIARIDPGASLRVQITPTDALAPGDLRIAWRNGLVVREAATLWRDVSAILVPQGLLDDDLVACKFNVKEMLDAK